MPRRTTRKLKGQEPQLVDYSPSAAQTYRFCQKKYYFTWLTRRKQGWRKPADHPWHQVYELKQLKQRQAWAGDLYHQTMTQMLNAAHSRRPVRELEARRFLNDLAAAQFAFSAERRFKGATKSHAPTHDGLSTFLALFEHAYDLPTDGLLRETQERVGCWLDNTFAWEGWALLLERVRSSRLVHIEPHNLLYTIAGARINARMDVGIEDTLNRQFRIYDWKCYQDDKRFAEHDQRAFKRQMLTYALWPVRRQAAPLPIERVSGHVFNPVTGESRELHFTEEDHADFELEVDRWVRLHAAVFSGVPDVEFDDLRGPFAPERSCPWCSFKGVCGKETAWHELT